MNKTFDDIFDEFMGINQRKNKSNKNDKSLNKGSFDLYDYIRIDHNNLSENIPFMIKNIIKTLIDFKDITNKGDKLGRISDDLGKPDSEESGTDGNTTFNKKTWDTDFGSITRISINGSIPPEGLDEKTIRDMINNLLNEEIVTRMPFPIDGEKSKPLSLEEQLELALAQDTVEGYKEAARLKMEIEKRDKKNKPPESP